MAPRGGPGSRGARIVGKIGRMSRVLWLAALACAIGALGLVLLVRDTSSAGPAGPESDAVSPAVERSSIDLVHPTATPVVERAPIAAAAPTPAARTPDADLVEEPEMPPFDGGTIEVRVVRDEDGAPLAGASVELAYYGGSASAISDAAGLALFTDVPEDRCRVVARAAQRAEAHATVPISRFKPRASIEVRVSVARTLVVRLVDPAGAPFRAEAWGIERGVARRIGIELARDCGAIGADSSPIGAPLHRARSLEPMAGSPAWSLEIRGPGDACVQAVLADRIIGATPLDPAATEVAVRIDVDAARDAFVSLVVRVIDARTGAPIEHALVGYGEARPADTGPRTGPDGRARPELVPARAVGVWAGAKGYAPEIVVLAEPIPAEALVRLRPGRRIRGRVVDFGGAPIAGAYVDAAADGGKSASTTRVTTAKDGAFELVDVRPARFRLRAVFESEVSPEPVAVDCTERDASEVELRVHHPDRVRPR